MEIWKDIEGYEGLYQISTCGNVKSLDRISVVGTKLKGVKLKTSSPSSRYDQVNLSNGESRTFAVHRIMAKAFLDKDYINKGLVVDHIDNNAKNNKLSNLQLITTRENTSKDRYRNRQNGYCVGVYKKGRKFCSMIEQNGESVYLGVFKTKKEAKRIYNNALHLINNGGDAKCLIVRHKYKNKHTGVSFHKSSNKWRSYYRENGKTIHIGLFKTEKDAKDALDNYLNKKQI